MAISTISPACRVYRISPRRRWLVILIWSLCVLPISITGIVTGDWAALVTGFIAGALLGFTFIVTAWHYPQLRLEPQGITLRQTGYTLEAPWVSVKCLWQNAGQAGIVLKSPMTCPGADRLAMVSRSFFGRIHTPEVRAMIADKRYIPLEPFVYWLQHGDLAAQLNTGAPGLAKSLETEP